MASEMTAKRKFYEAYMDIHKKIIGPKTVSTFQKTGQLTAKEFVEAGDALTTLLPSWEWAAGDAKIKEFLPPDKKYLIFRNCKSLQRCTTLYDVEGADVDAGDDWVATHSGHEERRQRRHEEELARQLAAEEARKAKAAAAAAKPKDDDDDGFYDDDDKDDDIAPDDGVTETTSCRLYNVSIVYDEYYQSPRVYLAGYSEKDRSKPLTAQEMYEDVFSENRDKTVTIDPHPFDRSLCISIHPCRHAETMKRILDGYAARLEEAQEGMPASEKVEFVFPPEKALFVFLKFIASVVPTIDYDTAIDLDM